MDLRERFYQKEILNIGDTLKGERRIVDRRSNYVVVADSSSNVTSMTIEEAYSQLTEDEKTVDLALQYDVSYFPKDLLEAIDPHITDNQDRYGVLMVLKGLSSLLLGEQPLSIYESVEKKMISLDPSLVLESFIPRPAKQTSDAVKIKSSFASSIINPSTECKTVVASKKPLTAIFESLEDAEKKLKSMTPDDVEHLANDVNDLEDIEHHYDEDEIVRHTKEHLSLEGRIKRKIEFRKSETKRERGREIALRRTSTPERLQSRARKAAVELIKKKIAHKDLDKLSVQEKNRLEDMIAKRKDLVERLARKLAPKIRQIEKDRLYHSHSVKEDAPVRVSSEDDIEEVEVVDGKDVVRHHPYGAVYDNGGIKDPDGVAV